MILTKQHFAIRCDGCGLIFEIDGHQYWDDLQGVLDEATNADWEHSEGNDVCPDCLDMNNSSVDLD